MRARPRGARRARETGRLESIARVTSLHADAMADAPPVVACRSRSMLDLAVMYATVPHRWGNAPGFHVFTFHSESAVPVHRVFAA